MGESIRLGSYSMSVRPALENVTAPENCVVSVVASYLNLAKKIFFLILFYFTLIFLETEAPVQPRAM